MNPKIEITTLSSGEKAQELSDKMVELINKYSDVLTGFELIGVIDAVKMSAHDSINEMEEKE